MMRKKKSSPIHLENSRRLGCGGVEGGSTRRDGRATLIRMVALLVSPPPVDGYPPVQYQARMLAEAGCDVVVLSTALPQHRGTISFSAHGVKVVAVPTSGGKFATWFLMLWQLSRLRRSYRGRRCLEICYDPSGVFVSDLAIGAPGYRVAHFHEYANLGEGRLGRRLSGSVQDFDEVVVPGSDRAVLTKEMLGLDVLPTSIPNYPDAGVLIPSQPPQGEFFDVVYCGSLGFHQQLHRVIESIAAWPSCARLTLIGGTEREPAQKLIAMVEELGFSERVTFTGWLDLPEAEARIAAADLAIAFLDMSFRQWSSALEASNKRYQYMKAGLPQIGDDCPGVVDLLEKNRVGRCIRRGDFTALPGLVTAYIEDHARRKEEGARARALFEERFNYRSAFQPAMNRWVRHQT